MGKKAFRVLVLGGGPVIELFHLPAIEALGWLPEALVVDQSELRLERLSKAMPGLRTRCGDFQDVLADPFVAQDFDVVLVALPNSLHASATEQALKIGLPVLCEKPLAMSGTECERLMRASAKGSMLSVAMVMRWLPGMIALKHALSEQMIGELQSVDVEDGNPFAWDSESGGYFTRANGGVLLNIGVHYLDLLGWLFGELAPVVYRDDAAGGVEANAEFKLSASGQVPVRMEVSYSRKLRNTLIVRGRLGRLVFDKSRPDGCDWWGNGVSGRLVPERPFVTANWERTLMGCFAEQLSMFAQAVRGKNPQPPVSANEALTVAKLIDWAMAHRQPLEPDLHFIDVSDEALQAVSGRVMLTGATGFVGTRLAAALCRRSSAGEIVALVRSFRSGAMIGRLPLRQVKGDLLDVDSIRAACRGARHVFHLGYGAAGTDSNRITIEGAVNVCRAAAAEGVESVVVVGTTAVYGPSDAPVDETMPLRRTGTAYELAKAEMVRQVLSLAASGAWGKMRVTVLEPACIYGPGGKAFTELPAELVGKNGMVWVEGGQGTANVVYVDNFVDAMLRAASREAANGKRLIVQDCCTTWRIFLTRLLGKEANRLQSMSPAEIKARNVPVPSSFRDVARAAIHSAELGHQLQKWPPVAMCWHILSRCLPGMASRLRHVRHDPAKGRRIQLLEQRETSPPAGPPDWLPGLYGSNSPVLVNDQAKQVLGWMPRVDLVTGLKRATGWLRYVRLLESEE
jgi:predicted dehydrogenase/nucleoside-diphosphate-sugar epimerase